jgi:chromosomal replication initiator protein
METAQTGSVDMDFDPRLTFETFVVGPANRLAYAAARRAAESPGTSYNPLFIYAASGLGKTHILSAMAHHTMKHHPERKVAYLPLENYLDELTTALERGDEDAMKERYRGLDTLLMDDVQFLTGQAQAQEMFLRALDVLTSRGAQVVLASDRPPSEIDDLDARLLSRFSGGLIVDIGVPDYETRVAIMRRKAEERGTTLGPGVAEAMARFRFSNVRELQGALNRVLAIQDLEGRPVSVDDLPALLGDKQAGGEAQGGEEGSTAVVEGPLAEAPLTEVPPSEPEWHRQIREKAMEAEEKGFKAERLRRLMEVGEGGPEPERWPQVLEQYSADYARAQEIDAELEELGNPWPEAATSLVKDPDRLEEAENLLASARERARPFPALPEGPRLEELKGRYPPLAVRAAERLVLSERPDYNPLYLHSRDLERRTLLLESAGRTYLANHPEGRVAFVSVPEFAEDFIRAISDGVAGAWRERWWTAEVLLLHGVEDLSQTERAQDEFFHLFEALKRRGSRILLAADRPPSGVEGVDDRLRTRFEGGLVVELGEDTAKVAPGAAAKPAREAPAAPSPATETSPPAPEPATEAPAAPGTPGSPAGERARAAPAEPAPAQASARETPPEQPAPTGGRTTDARSGGVDDDIQALRELTGIGRGRRAVGPEDSPESLVVAAPESEAQEEPGEGAWFPSPERVVWDWPRMEECIVEGRE